MKFCDPVSDGWGISSALIPGLFVHLTEAKGNLFFIGEASRQPIFTILQGKI
jgi:hypothetical protein